MEVSGQLHTTSALRADKRLRHVMHRRLRGPQSRSGHGSEEKKPAPARNWTPVVQPVD
jgi:hypothetical protein